MKKLVEKLYTPAEMIELQKELKIIYDAWFGSTERPEQSFVNATIVRLHKVGYRIVKV